MYYSGFFFTPSTASHFCKVGKLTTAEDAAHCDGVGSKSYGMTYKVVEYDAKNCLIPLDFAHYVGLDYYDSWKRLFKDWATIEGFDVGGRNTVVDQEKGIYKALMKCITSANLFIESPHVKKILKKTREKLSFGHRCLHEDSSRTITSGC